MKKYYFDHNASTPLRPEVLDSMMPLLTDCCGNPSSVHSWGREAKDSIEESRKTIAGILGAEPEEIFFTGCGTEADNMAIFGCLRNSTSSRKGLVTSKIEHSAVLKTAEAAATQGYPATFAEVDENCMVYIDDLRRKVNDSTAIVSIMQANNETGTIQNIREAAAIAHSSGALFHSDAIQSAGKIAIDVNDLDVDLLSISAHKFNGPKGVGALYIRNGVDLKPVMYGGSHEKGLRPGTYNTAGIVGMASALKIASEEMEDKRKALEMLRNMIEDGIGRNIPDTIFNGRNAPRIPNTVNVSFPGIDGEALLFSLDMAGIAVSTGSACSSGEVEPSHVLVAMGRKPKIAQGSLRISMGMGTTEEGAGYLLEVLPPLVERLRRISDGI